MANMSNFEDGAMFMLLNDSVTGNAIIYNAKGEVSYDEQFPTAFEIKTFQIPEPSTAITLALGAFLSLALLRNRSSE